VRDDLDVAGTCDLEHLRDGGRVIAARDVVDAEAGGRRRKP
jgi:hypothetical protein